MLKTILILLPALIQVESGGDCNAIGDNFLARGILQIHKAYCIDGCEELGVDWHYEGAFNGPKSACVTIAYLTRYGRRYEQLTGKKVTLKVLAKLHNGGLNGWRENRKKATEPHWQKVKKELENGI